MDPGNDMPSNCGHPGCTKQPSCGTASRYSCSSMKKAEFGAEHAPEDMNNVNHEYVERHPTYTHGLGISAQVEALMRDFKHVVANGDEYMAGALTREQVAQRAADASFATLQETNLEADAGWRRSQAARARARATSGAPHQMSHESDAKRRMV